VAAVEPPACIGVAPQALPMARTRAVINTGHPRPIENRPEAWFLTPWAVKDMEVLLTRRLWPLLD
jgi:hypothetical protein